MKERRKLILASRPRSHKKRLFGIENKAAISVGHSGAHEIGSFATKPLGRQFKVIVPILKEAKAEYAKLQ